MGDPSKFGRYELRRILGRGAMGVVYEGFDPSLGRPVAVKTILKSAVTDDETAASYSARFAREAKAAARLSHSHIVQVYDFGEQDEVAYLVMEFIQGRELRTAFEAGERFDAAEAVRIMSELLGALDFAHEAGVVHRDVKPANVMLDAQGRVKLADFGVARLQDGNDRSKGGTMVGTPAFMSPEQISGARVDRRTDVFSAGIVLYQLLTGEQPFKGEGAWTVAKQIMQDEPPRPSTLVERVPPVFDQIVNRALAKKPDQRYASAKEFAAALQGALAGGGAARGSDAEIEFWRSIQNSSDPAEFAVYLKEFPDGVYAELARLKLAKLPAAAEPSVRDEPDAELEAEKSRLEAEFAAREAEYRKREAEAQARAVAEEKARLEAIEQAKREAEAALARKEAEYRRREAEARARAEAEEKARAAAELRAKQEAEALAAKARAEVEAQARRQAEEFARAKAEAEARAKKEAAERARRDAEIAAREAKLQRQLAAGSRAGIPLLPIIVAVAILAGVVGAWYWRTTSEEARIAALTATLEAATRASEDLKKARQAALEAQQRAADARAAEAEAQKAGDAAALKAATDARLKAEADAMAQAKLVQQREADAKKAEEAAKSADAKKQTEAVKAAEKAAAEKAAAEKAAAEKAAAEKLAAEKAASEKAAADKLAAGKAAAEKAAAERAAAEKLAAAKSAEKVASRPAGRPAGTSPAGLALPKPGDRWVYNVRNTERKDQSYESALEVKSATAAEISYAFQVVGKPEAPNVQKAGTYSVRNYGPGLSLLSPYLLYQERLQPGDLRGFDSAGSSCHYSNYSCAYFATIAGKERISVPAGAFDTWKVVVHMNVGIGSLMVKVSFAYWYHESTGVLVKYERRILPGNAGGYIGASEPDVDMELEKTEHAAAQQAAAPKLLLPSVGDRWDYNVRTIGAQIPDYKAALEVRSADPSGIAYMFKSEGKTDVEQTHKARARVMTSVGLGVSLFSPFLLSYERLRPEADLPGVEGDATICFGMGLCSFVANAAGKEKVSVPAGAFDAEKIVVTGVFQPSSAISIHRVQFTYWLAESVGTIVKYQRRAISGTSVLPDVELELLSYTSSRTK